MSSGIRNPDFLLDAAISNKPPDPPHAALEGTSLVIETVPQKKEPLRCFVGIIISKEYVGGLLTNNKV